ncbi:6-pyruvoyl-tetrahydropterin synthase-related protein [Patescibacteria group bacterium]
MKKNKLLPTVIFSILSIFLLKALFSEGFYTSHDGPSHLSRVAQYTIALKDGQFPPRWASGLYGGLGYPVFVYSYHLPFFISSVIHQMGASIVNSVKILYLVGFAASGFGMYLFLKEYYSDLESYVGSIFYLLFPYRFIVIFVRSAIGEALSIALVPYALWALTKVMKNGSKKWIALSSLLLFAAVTSHTLFLTTFFPIILLIVLIKKSKYKNKAIASILIGLVCSSFMLVPQLFERKYSGLDDYFQSNSTKHLVSLKQLIRSPWGYGYSHPGVEDDAMSFQIGLIHLFVLGLSVFKLFNKRSKINQKSQNTFWLVVALCSIVLMIDTPAIFKLWSGFLSNTAIDIPWRLLGIVGLSTSILSADLISFAKHKKTLSFLLIIFLFYANRNHLRINQQWVVSDEDVYEMHDTTTYLNEFKPSWRGNSGLEKVDEKVLVVEKGKEQKVDIINSKSNLIEFETNFANSGDVNINTLYFPGWSIEQTRNTKTKTLHIGRDYFIRKNNIEGYSKKQVDGTIYLKAPEGKTFYKISFSETPIRKLGNYASIVGFSLILILMTSGLYTKNSE